MEAPWVGEQGGGVGPAEAGCEEAGEKIWKGWEGSGAGEGVEVGSSGEEGEGATYEGEGFKFEEVLGESWKGGECLLGAMYFGSWST